MKARFLVAISLLFFPFLMVVDSAFATSRFTGVLRWPATAVRSVCGDTDRGLVFSGEADRVMVYDTSDGTLLGRLKFPVEDGIKALSYSPDQKMLYVACGLAGFKVVDVKDPATPLLHHEFDENPENAGSLDPNGKPVLYTFVPSGIAYHDKKVFVADFVFGLKVYDVTDPENPVRIAGFRQGSEDAAGGYHNIFVQDVPFRNNTTRTLISVLDKYKGLRVFDLHTMPEDEKDITSWTPVSYSMRSKTYYGLSFVVGLYGADQWMHVTDEERGITNFAYGWKTDTSSGKSTVTIEKKGQCATPGTATDVTVFQDRAYVADSANGLAVIDISPLYDENDDEKVTDESLRKEEGLINDLSGAHSLWRAEDTGRLFMANYAGGLTKIRTGTPAVREKSLSPSIDIVDIQANANMAALADAGDAHGFRLLDISPVSSPDPSRPYFPVQFSEMPTRGVPLTIWLAEKMVLTAEGIDGVGLYDITQPRSPVFLHQVATSGPAVNLLLQKTTLFLAVTGVGVEIWNIETPKTPVKTATIPFAAPIAMAQKENHLWVIDDAEGLVPVDIANLQSPVKGEAIAIDSPNDIALDVLAEAPDSGEKRAAKTDPGPQDAIFVASKVEGLFVYIPETGESTRFPLVNLDEIKDEAGATQTISTELTPETLFVYDGFAFLSCGKHGIKAVNVKEPLQPESAAHMDSYGRMHAGVLVSPDIYTADGPGGLAVVRFIENVTVDPAKPLGSVDSGSSCFLSTVHTDSAPPEKRGMDRMKRMISHLFSF